MPESCRLKTCRSNDLGKQEGKSLNFTIRGHEGMGIETKFEVRELKEKR